MIDNINPLGAESAGGVKPRNLSSPREPEETRDPAKTSETQEAASAKSNDSDNVHLSTEGRMQGIAEAIEHAQKNRDAMLAARQKLDEQAENEAPTTPELFRSIHETFANANLDEQLTKSAQLLAETPPGQVNEKDVQNLDENLNRETDRMEQLLQRYRVEMENISASGLSLENGNIGIQSLNRISQELADMGAAAGQLTPAKVLDLLT